MLKVLSKSRAKPSTLVRVARVDSVSIERNSGLSDRICYFLFKGGAFFSESIFNSWLKDTHLSAEINSDLKEYQQYCAGIESKSISPCSS